MIDIGFGVMSYINSNSVFNRMAQKVGGETQLGLIWHHKKDKV